MQGVLSGRYHGQGPNSWISPELAFRFRYFAIRKMHFLMHARGLVAFPGGYGTLDELFEVLTLIQTGMMAAIPVVLVGRSFWSRTIDFDYLVEEGYIAPQDRALFTCVFRAFDADVERAANSMSAAAQQEDGAGVIRSFSEIQQACLGCHQQFRKPFVEHFYGRR